MKRTRYSDGIEVDASDLNNTETSKIDEILKTRTNLERFGVIEGLSLSIINNAVRVDIGKASFFNGEIAVVDTPIENLVGASFDPGRSSFFGLRLTEASSDPKPHETDPITVNVRVNPRIKGEFFVAITASSDDRQAALDKAVAAQTNDGNFILLGEITGSGSGIAIQSSTQNSP